MSDRLLFAVVGVALAVYLLVSLVQLGVYVYNYTHPSNVLPPREVVVHLPVKCDPYYNDGTERWINCMGVGYVREEDNEHD